MAPDTLSPDFVDRIARAWRGLAGPQTPERGSCIVGCAADQGIAPDGWMGLVSLETEVVVSTPPALLPEMRRRLGRRLTPRLLEIDMLQHLLGGIDDLLGPALLLYAERVRRPAATAVTLAWDSGRLDELFDQCDEADVREAGIDADGAVITATIDGGIAGAAGYDVWAGGLAHIGALTAPRFRRRGVAVAGAGLLAQSALAAGLIPQWRAAVGNSASINAARRLGFVELGRQISVRPAP